MKAASKWLLKPFFCRGTHGKICLALPLGIPLNLVACFVRQLELTTTVFAQDTVTTRNLARGRGGNAPRTALARTTLGQRGRR